MTYYISPGREKLARRIKQLRGQGYDRADIVAFLEGEGHPNEWVLVNSIFDAPIPERFKTANRPRDAK